MKGVEKKRQDLEREVIKAERESHILLSLEGLNTQVRIEGVYRTLLCPVPRQLTTSGLCCRVSLLMSAQGGEYLLQPGIIISSFFFPLGSEKTRVFNKLEPRKESQSERGGSYEGQNKVELFALNLENLGVRLQ